MFFFLLAMMVLLIPLVAIVLDSHLGRALAARFERREIGPAGDLITDRLVFLEGEVERLAGEVKRLDEEGRFLHQLLEKRGPERPALGDGERRD